jgi:hypothetical protein
VEINFKTDIYERLRALFHTNPAKEHTITHRGDQLKTKEEQDQFLRDHHITAETAFSRKVLFPLLSALHKKVEEGTGAEREVANKLIPYIHEVGRFDDHADTADERVQKRIETWKRLLKQYVILSDEGEIEVFNRNVHLIEEDDTLFHAYSTVQMLDVIIQRVAVDLTQAVVFASQSQQ